MYLLDAIQQLHDLYDERIVVRCFTKVSSLADPEDEEYKGYSLIYLWDGVPYYSAIWLARSTLFWRLEADLHEAMRRGVPLGQLSDYEALISKTEDQGDWDVISPDRLAAYHLMQFDKEASNET